VTHAPTPRLALESTLLVHGLPPGQGGALAGELARLCRSNGAEPAVAGVLEGRPVIGMSDEELRGLLARSGVEKLNTGSLGAAMARGAWGATTVSTTMELAAGAGVRVFATGGLGGVHRGLGERLDISADLLAFTRFPVAVVTAGCKSILDVVNTRELLETLGVPVIGYRTDRFPAFYRRDGGVGVDARFDDMGKLGAFVRAELARTCRGIVVCNPIPVGDELPEADWTRWLGEAEKAARAKGAVGRDVTPAILGALHEVSGGRTLAANLALVKHNVEVGAKLAAAVGV
jgi:pseudouridine-5'-phosphate glycosidase